jgi:hypothetical protein
MARPDVTALTPLQIAHKKITRKRILTMTSATVVATIILASIMATVTAATGMFHHDIMAFQISPIHNHRRRCRFISSSRTNDEPRILLRRHLDYDSVGGVQLRRPHSHLGVSFAPLVREMNGCVFEMMIDHTQDVMMSA